MTTPLNCIKAPETLITQNFKDFVWVAARAPQIRRALTTSLSRNTALQNAGPLPAQTDLLLLLPRMILSVDGCSTIKSTTVPRVPLY